MDWYNVMVIFAITFLTIIFFLITRSDWNPRTLRFMKNVPCPKHLFIFGIALDFQVSQEAIFNFLRQFAIKCPRLYQLWIINYVSISMIHPDDLEKLFSSTKQITKGKTYSLLEPWLQFGLLTNTGLKWHHRRKLLTPAFHFSILKKFTTVFAEQSFKTIEELKKRCGDSHVEILDYISDFALNTISETAMGYNQESGGTELKSYKHSVYKYGEMVIYRLFRPWLHNSKMFFFTPSGYKSRKLVANLHSFTRKVIKKRINEFDKSIVQNIDNDGNTDVMTKKRLAMLDLLIYQRLNDAALIDDEGIAEEVDTFMFEGHDTTATGISFALMLLANHKDIQERAYEEIIKIMGDDRTKLPTYNDLQQMTYLERCIKEGLRLYPPVAIIARNLDEDLELDDYIIPKQTEIYVHIYDVHRHPDFWPNPNVFDPDRFLPENTQKRHPFAFIPFSAGPRNCIGQKFALLEEKALISTILRNFILEPVDTPETIVLLSDIILRTKTPLKIKVVTRPQKFSTGGP